MRKFRKWARKSAPTNLRPLCGRKSDFYYVLKKSLAAAVKVTFWSSILGRINNYFCTCKVFHDLVEHSVGGSWYTTQLGSTEAMGIKGGLSKNVIKQVWREDSLKNLPAGTRIGVDAAHIRLTP